MNNWRQIAIFEDDAEISTKSPDEFKEQLSGALDELTRIGKWDILLLATANKQETSLPDKKYISRVTGSTTSSGYIIKSHYYEKLLGLFEYINTMMEKDKWTAGGHEPWALDQKWIDLQKLDAWYCCKSDIITRHPESIIFSHSVILFFFLGARFLGALCSYPFSRSLRIIFHTFSIFGIACSNHILFFLIRTQL